MNWLAILRAIAPKGNASILQGVANAMPGMIGEFDLSTPLRQAHFLAQIAHESDGFKTATEYASGKAYEGRKDLGNTSPGDGVRYKGRGLIQLTGKANYRAAGLSLGVDILANPELAAAFPTAIRSAGWYWKTHNINALADKDDEIAVTRKVNGGENGLASRREYLDKAKTALAANPEDLPEAKPKTMANSKTGNAAIVGGVAGAGAAVQTAKDAIQTANDAKDAAGDAWGLLASAGPWVAVAVVIVAAAAFIWWDRRKKMQEHGV